MSTYIYTQSDECSFMIKGNNRLDKSPIRYFAGFGITNLHSTIHRNECENVQLRLQTLSITTQTLINGCPSK